MFCVYFPVIFFLPISQTFPQLSGNYRRCTFLNEWFSFLPTSRWIYGLLLQSAAVRQRRVSSHTAQIRHAQKLKDETKQRTKSKKKTKTKEKQNKNKTSTNICVLAQTPTASNPNAPRTCTIQRSKQIIYRSKQTNFCVASFFNVFIFLSLTHIVRVRFSFSLLSSPRGAE